MSVSLRELAWAWQPLWFKARPKNGPATHDYVAPLVAGHDYTFEPLDGGLRARMSGWGAGLRKGDYLLLGAPKHAPTRTTRYRITKVEYCADPADMWFADVSFAPRQEPK